MPKKNVSDPTEPSLVTSDPTDVPSEASSDDEEVAVPVRVKRHMSDERLAQLAVARQKAVEMRKQLGDLTRREKALKVDLLAKRIESLRCVEESEKTEVCRKTKSRSNSKLKPVSSESESEPEIVRKPSRRHRQAAAAQTPPDSPQRERTPRQPKSYSTPQLTAEIARRELQQRVQRDTYQQAFSSMFPGAVLQM